MIQPINNTMIANNTTFSGRTPKKKDIEIVIDHSFNNTPVLSDKAKKLVKRVDEAIDLNWKKIRKNKEDVRNLRFEYTDKANNKKITITPIYQSMQNDVLLQIEGEKNIERVLIRRDGQRFKYENSIKTDHGFMTGKQFDSSVDKNQEIADIVSATIESYIPKMIRQSDIDHLQHILFKL